MALTAAPAFNHAGVLAFKPSAVVSRMKAPVVVDISEKVLTFALDMAELSEKYRTEARLAEYLAEAARQLPKSHQILFLEQAADLLEKSNLIVPDPTPLTAEQIAAYQEIKSTWQANARRNPFVSMMNAGCWSWAHAAEKEDEMYPERKAERERKAAAALAEMQAEEARQAEDARRQEYFIASNKNPSLRLGNLYRGVTEEALAEQFAVFGRTTRINVPRSRETGETRGFAFIDYASPADAAKAYLAFSNSPLVLKGEPVRIEFAATELRKPVSCAAGELRKPAAPAADGWTAMKSRRF